MEPVLVAAEAGLTGFPARLDSLRVRLRIPGMAASLAVNGTLAWAGGFGLANAETGVAAAPDTPFHLASLTKPFAATVLMQLVEEGGVDLDAPVSDYGLDLPGAGVVRVRHLLTHTSEGVPGSSFRYNGNRFGNLDQVIQAASGRTFAALLVERILKPLGLPDTAPNPLQPSAFALAGLDRAGFLREMAAGYQIAGSSLVPLGHPDYFGTAAGLVASVRDVAAFSIAIDEGRLLAADSWTRVFTPATSNAGDTLPYALGWFIQRLEGTTLQWHYGYWTTNSSLIVRVPERKMTFVVLANTSNLSAAFPGLGADDNVLSSEVARLFVEAFVMGDEPLPAGGIDRP